VPVDDQSSNDQVLEPIVMPLYDKVLQFTQAVAMSKGEVSLGGHVIVVSVDCG
jgi:hypothetical protein